MSDGGGADLHAHPLDEGDLDPDPFKTFASWFDEGSRTVRLPEAMALATATQEGEPSVRMVLLKGFDEHGFVFYTGYDSRKGRDLAENPLASLLFYWDPLGRQVRIDGGVMRVSPDESDRYFGTRPEGARLSAVASRQSTVIPSRDMLEARVEELRREFGAEVARPEDWGGYRLTPTEFEFWQHREDRLHDRFRYRRSGSDWVVERLSP